MKWQPFKPEDFEGSHWAAYTANKRLEELLKEAPEIDFAFHDETNKAITRRPKAATHVGKLIDIRKKSG